MQPLRLCEALALVVLAAVAVAGTNVACPSASTIDTDGTRWAQSATSYGMPATWKESSGFDAALRKEYETAFNLATSFLGKYAAYIYLLEPNGDDSAYTSLVAHHCQHQGLVNPVFDGAFYKDACGKQPVASAKQGGGKFFSQPTLACACKTVYSFDTSMFMIPSVGAAVAPQQEALIHEYFHVYTSATTPLAPQWMSEGGAVLLRCLFSTTLKPADLFRDCLYSGGGRSGIVPGVRKLYTPESTVASEQTAWLKVYGEDRKNDNPLSKLGNKGKMADGTSYEDHVYYDAGAAAVLFAADRSAKHHGITTKQALINMFQSHEAGKGFWLVAEDYTLDTSINKDASQVPEGAGWRKALAAYTGDDSVATFYTAFDNFAYALGAKDGSALIALAPGDDDVKALIATPYKAPAGTVTYPSWQLKQEAAKNAICAPEAATPGAAATTAATTTTAAAPTSAVLVLSHAQANCSGMATSAPLDPIDATCRETGGRWNKYAYANGATSCGSGVSIEIFRGTDGRGYQTEAVCKAATTPPQTLAVNTCGTEFALAGVAKSTMITCASSGSALRVSLLALAVSVAAAMFA